MSVKKTCEHGNEDRFCKECKSKGTGGTALCEHLLIRSQCRSCKKLGIGGVSICEHGVQRYECKKCGGNGICIHNRTKRTCKVCKGTSVCCHNKQRRNCSFCCPKGIYQSYSRHEKNRGNGSLPLDFMTLSEFCELVKKDCWFCNASPEQANGMGVDRIDNSKGHVSGNLEPCCGVCNKMRMDLTREEFLERCLKITKNHTQ